MFAQLRQIGPGKAIAGVMTAWAVFSAASATAAETIPPEIVQPGTQPFQVASFATNCDNCHYRTDAQVATEPEHRYLPSRGWQGSMMSHSMRDPLFWATVAVAEQVFLPDPDPAERGGVGDLCLRCHAPGGWLAGRSTPTDGSAMTGDDERGVECEFCHLLVDPDEPVNVAGTDEKYPPGFEPYDSTTKETYRGSGQYVVNAEGTRLGPYDDTLANHAVFTSPFHRSGDLCGTCHDVSNPAVGDLAHNNGAQVPLEPGSFSGVLGSPAQGKAAFNNPPYRYGVVERTYSEWKASALDSFRVNDYPSLPPELRETGGSLDTAYHQAYDARSNADYADGTPRTFTCQTCHMPSVSGKGCNKSNRPIRDDLPQHDLSGAAHWMLDAVQYQADQGTLRFGSLTSNQRVAMADGKLRALAMIRSAGSLHLAASGETLVVRTTNLTGHKLISGYPEGRRMWLNVKWFDRAGSPIDEQGVYGPLARPAAPTNVDTILDPERTVIFQAGPGMDQQWAGQLLALGYDPALALAYDPLTDAVAHTLGELADEPPGTAYHTLHFVLNNVMIEDNRIPPYGMSYDESVPRSVLPVPERQYGGRGPGSTFDHANVAAFTIPEGAVDVEVRLLYQQTSWEYIQFLWLANDGESEFLGREGENLLDAWLNTGMAEPVEIATASASLVGVSEAPGETSAPGDTPLRAEYDRSTGEIQVTYEPACGATDHTVYFGSLSNVGAHLFDGAVCAAGNSGSLQFDPGIDDVFFLVVGNNGAVEGSYGLSSDGTERTEDAGTPVCDIPQDLSGTCASK